jgi:hypothetical protein
MHIASHLRGLKPKFPFLWQHEMLGKLECLHSDNYTDHLLCFNWSKRKAKTRHRCMAPCDRDQQGWPDTCECPVQANNLVPLQTDITCTFNIENVLWEARLFQGCVRVTEPTEPSSEPIALHHARL